MAKAKTKGAQPKKKTSRSDPKAKTADEIQNVRNRVNNVIFKNSEAMAKRVVLSVTEGGQVAALKYLWDMEREQYAGSSGVRRNPCDRHADRVR